MSVFEGNHVHDAFVVVTTPRLRGNDLIYDVDILEVKIPAIAEGSSPCSSTPKCAGSRAERPAETSVGTREKPGCRHMIQGGCLAWPSCRRHGTVSEQLLRAEDKTIETKVEHCESS